MFVFPGSQRFPTYFSSKRFLSKGLWFTLIFLQKYELWFFFCTEIFSFSVTFYGKPLESLHTTSTNHFSVRAWSWVLHSLSLLWAWMYALAITIDHWVLHLASPKIRQCHSSNLVHIFKKNIVYSNSFTIFYNFRIILVIPPGRSNGVLMGQMLNAGLASFNVW